VLGSNFPREVSFAQHVGRSDQLCRFLKADVVDIRAGVVVEHLPYPRSLPGTHLERAVVPDATDSFPRVG
jgi:hypothetical protein